MCWVTRPGPLVAALWTEAGKVVCHPESKVGHCALSVGVKSELAGGSPGGGSPPPGSDVSAGHTSARLITCENHK